MPASSFDKRNISTSRQPWLATLSPGVSLANLFALYPSKGDVTIDVDTSIPSTLDGPIQVARYGALTVNAALTASNRCRGLVILADSLVMGAAGSISMTARGAAGSSKWANQDIGIPTSIVLSGKNTSQKAFLDWLASTGYCIFDPTLFACPQPGQGDVIADYTNWPSVMSAIVSAAGCGAYKTGATSATATGQTGSAGSNGGTGGGATGGQNGASGLPCLPGRVWGGAPGQCGTYSASGIAVAGDPFGGQGGQFAIGNAAGGAGNPSGNSVSGSLGTGGVLIIIVRGNVTLTTGHILAANGMPGETTALSGGCGGGGSGGGSVSLLCGGTLTGTPNMTATGGAAGAGPISAGGAGGAGSTTSGTFTSKGWT